MFDMLLALVLGHPNRDLRRCGAPRRLNVAAAALSAKIAPSPEPGGDHVLRIVPQRNVDTDASGSARVNVGDIDPIATPTFVEQFVLKKVSPSPITRLQSSCHCTSAVVSAAEGQSLNAALDHGPTMLHPGQEASTRVAVDVAGLPAGDLTKAVSVFVEGYDGPQASLTVSGHVKPVIYFGHQRWTSVTRARREFQ
jgi:hypothetical protein